MWLVMKVPVVGVKTRKEPPDATETKRVLTPLRVHEGYEGR